MLIIARFVDRSGQNFESGFGRNADARVEEAEPARARGGEVGFRHLGEARLALDQQRAPAGGDGGDSNGAAATEGVEHESAGRAVEVEDLDEKLDWFWSGMAVGRPDARYLEDVLLAPEYLVSGENARWPPAGGGGEVVLLAV